MTSTPPLPADDEIDLRQLAAALGRRWPWILAGGLGGLLVAGIATSRSKPVWEGEFQIVLAKRDTGAGSGLASLAASNPMLANLAGLGAGGGGSELETEVKILESPSVLKPVFDLVKTRKTDSAENETELRFADWVKDSLTIELEKGTSVLNIAYRDTDQSLVLPVMQQISKAYQNYSGRDRSDSLRNGLAYAQRQAARFRQQAAASNKALDAFRIRYGISSTGGSIASAGIDVSKFLTAAAGKDAGAAVQIQGGSSSSTFSTQGDPLGQLAAINQELIRRRQTFTDQDPAIAALLKERDALRSYIETTGGGNLALPGSRSLSKEEAQQILLRYQELERTAKRDTATLDSLENTLLSLQLEQARATKPWELISKPTLLEKPVSPRPARNLALGLLAGLVFGSGAALVADRRSGRVFSEVELEMLLKGKPLARLHGSNAEASATTLALLCQHQLQGCTSVALVPVGLSANDERLATLKAALQAQLPEATFMLCTNLLMAERCGHQLLITAPGAASRHDLAELRQQLDLQGNVPLGWLLLEGGDA
jgi:succinoglycan biosynthesis transport protein ExoP